MLIKPITALTDDVDELIQQSRRYQQSIYPAESINQDDPQKLVNGEIYFIGAYEGSHLYGIGGVKIMDDDSHYGEIKNLFVNPKFRGKGVSKQIMQALEAYLAEHQVNLCRLETGVNQPESISLYQRLGYRDRNAYGAYHPDPLSIFMEKQLS